VSLFNFKINFLVLKTKFLEKNWFQLFLIRGGHFNKRLRTLNLNHGSGVTGEGVNVRIGKPGGRK
jgi:hypothetical protein